jgi:hypothetical protein
MVSINCSIFCRIPYRYVCHAVVLQLRLGPLGHRQLRERLICNKNHKKTLSAIAGCYVNSCFINFTLTPIMAKCRERGGTICIATGCGMEDRGSGFDSRRGPEIFLFSTVSEPAPYPMVRK